MKTNVFTLFSLIFFISVISGYSQNIDSPQPNPRSSIMQRVGLTYVTIEYSSSPVNNRKKFGNDIPYGQIWGAGTRENTTIEFTNDVLIEGQKINAGKYGLFMIPDETKFQLVFSKYSRSWSDTYPTEDEIVLKVTATPKENRFTEWMSYNFIDRKMEHCIATLEWENISVPFKIEVVNPNEVLFKSLTAELKGRGKYLWGAYSDAATNLNWRNIHLDTALDWINESLKIERNHINLQVKASILIKIGGRNDEVKELLREAVPISKNPLVLNSIVYDLLKINDTKMAIEAAHKLVNDNPNHTMIWGFNDTLAEAYKIDGNKKKALDYYKIAKSLAPENQLEYFEKAIKELQN